MYADIWLHRTSPLSAINRALEEALDDATVPTSAVGKAAKTPVKKIGALGAALELGDEPKRRALLKIDKSLCRQVPQQLHPRLEHS